MWLMPSFGRPEALERLLEAPGGWPDEVFVLVNKDDPKWWAYVQAAGDLDGPWRIRIVPQGSRFADAVRYAFTCVTGDASFYGILDDDYFPVTPGWHEKMVAAAGPNAIAIANNKVSFPKPHCCRVMGGDLARAIGTIAPGAMRHNFSDDTWGRFAEDFGLLRPLEDVIVEHRHHGLTQGVPNDATYERGSHDFAEDQKRFQEWLDSDERKEQCARVASLLGIGVTTKDLRKVHLAICTPTQSMQVDVTYFVSYTHSMIDLAKSGVRYTTYPTFGGSHIGKAREHVLWRAMADPSITHFLFIDDDMGWDAHLPVRLIMAGHDFCAAVGVRKKENIDPDYKFCFNPLPPPARFHGTTKFLEVRHVGFAFVMLTRAAVEKMIAAYPELQYDTGDKPPEWALFFDLMWEREGKPLPERLSEDFAFCERWRAIGGEIWIDPQAELTHVGRKEFTGKPSETFRPFKEIGAVTQFDTSSPLPCEHNAS